MKTCRKTVFDESLAHTALAVAVQSCLFSNQLGSLVHSPTKPATCLAFRLPHTNAGRSLIHTLPNQLCAIAVHDPSVTSQRAALPVVPPARFATNLRRGWQNRTAYKEVMSLLCNHSIYPQYLVVWFLRWQLTPRCNQSKTVP